ncbi:carbamoyltransferase HypF [Pontibacter saemangeumensis]|uniref:Carbamoyltransferase n=1 Tax=Pontibacter saemangeumensis TaxID=1084525 RepID=A0ABP8LU63_9BACT
MRNQSDGLYIKVKGEAQQVLDFYGQLKCHPPALARIQSASIESIGEEDLAGFQIIKESPSVVANLILTPDLAMCASCRSEIKDSTNRRYNYAFTTCTCCGPRYSIMAKLPYEREHTTMAPFAMCEQCEREYDDPENRRYFSQTNSCPACPVLLILYTVRQQMVTADQQAIIPAAVQLLQEGYIIAVKGIGGYLLLADATNAQTIRTLRARKRRPSKPFALMYPDLETAQRDVQLKEEEIELLQGTASPIVLAQKKTHPAAGTEAELVAPRLNKLGVMLPYTPLFELLLSQLKKPVIATSANTHGHHISFRDQDVFRELAGIADYVLQHDRDILVSQDDSVVQVTPRHRQSILLRRSRGFAPSVVREATAKESFLALGADQKSTFSFTSSGNLYISQYLGNLSFYDNVLNLEQSLEHLASLYGFSPSHILTDKHPDYTSVILGKRLAQQYNLPCEEVQHHEAHFAAVLDENQLLESQEPVLGVIWDGTGLGNDNLIRGGEFLLLQNNRITPLAQIEPYPHLAGDKMAIEPRLSALALCFDAPGAEALLKLYYSTAEWKLYQSILQGAGYKRQTTSMGRIFDAAAALLGLCSQMSYEGEAAMLLEASAAREPELYGVAGYALDVFNGKNISFLYIIRQIIKDVQQGLGTEHIAAKFHVTLVEVVRIVAEHYALKRIAFSGGVFQNCLLTDLLIDKLSPDFQLYFHQQLPPNDECVSYGQLAWMQLKGKPGEVSVNAKNILNHPINP